MRIAVVYNQPKPGNAEDHWISRSHSDGVEVSPGFVDASEHGVVEQAQLIASILEGAGHAATLFGASDLLGLGRFLTDRRPDLVFNCCESLQGNAADEMAVAALYESLGIQFTGSPALTLGAALHKDFAKALFQAARVPTPPWTVAPEGHLPEMGTLAPPLIVKPLREDASIGIGTDSVVTTQAALHKRVRFIWNEFHQPALVEEFIEGREVNASLLATAASEFKVLPLSEIAFEGFPGPHQLVTFEAKWMPGTPQYRATPPRCPADLPTPLADQIRSTALRAAQAIHLRDYGRIDFRIRRSDNAIFVLEANPNPDISADSGFARAAQAAGHTHAEAILQIVECARQRVVL